VLHSTCTHRDRVDSRLLMVVSQIASSIPGPSFDHNLYCRCPNDSCEAILDIYTSISFQWYKEHFNARCFDPCNHVLNFWESRRIPKSHFWECEWWPHISLKEGLRHLRACLCGFHLLVYVWVFYYVVRKWKCSRSKTCNDGNFEEFNILFLQKGKFKNNHRMVIHAL